MEWFLILSGLGVLLGIGMVIFSQVMLWRNHAVYVARMAYIDSPRWTSVTLNKLSYDTQLWDLTIWTKQGFLNQLTKEPS